MATLAQSTQPTEAAGALLFVAIILFLAACSAAFIVRRRLYVIPPIPEDDQTPTIPILAATLATSAFIFLGVVQLMAFMMGVNAETAQTPEGMRKLLLCPPAAQFITAGALLVLMGGYMPRVFHWTPGRGHVFRQAALGYLLALPWVMLCGLIVASIAQRFVPDAKMVHPIFESWNEGGEGAGTFKAFAIFSSVISAPLAEELFFRGVAQRLVHRLTGNGFLAIVLASIAFASIHSPWTIKPPIFLLSLFLGWVYFRSGNILVPILMHALFNGMQFVWFLFVMPLLTPPT